MNEVWVAYNWQGDLVASADTEYELRKVLQRNGISEDEVHIGRTSG